jgi:hypothetical protein
VLAVPAYLMTAKRNMSPPITPRSENLPLFLEHECLQGKAVRRVAISAPRYLFSPICNQLKIHNIKSLTLVATRMGHYFGYFR